MLKGCIKVRDFRGRSKRGDTETELQDNKLSRGYSVEIVKKILPLRWMVLIIKSFARVIANARLLHQ